MLGGMAMGLACEGGCMEVFWEGGICMPIDPPTGPGLPGPEGRGLIRLDSRVSSLGRLLSSLLHSPP